MNKKIRNPKVVLFSLFAIAFVILAILTKNWLFIIPAVILMILNQKELFKKKNGRK